MARSAVANLWAKRLEDGREANFNNVPAKLKDEVRVILDEDGYTVNPDGTVVKK